MGLKDNLWNARDIAKARQAIQREDEKTRVSCELESLRLEAEQKFAAKAQLCAVVVPSYRIGRPAGQCPPPLDEEKADVVHQVSMPVYRSRCPTTDEAPRAACVVEPPVIWMPTQPYQLSEIKNLKGSAGPLDLCSTSTRRIGTGRNVGRSVEGSGVLT